MAPDLATTGSLIIFFCLVSIEILLGLITLSYAGYSFLLTLVNTAAGNDEVHWPGDPIMDWIWMFLYLFWVAAIWLVPAALLFLLYDIPAWPRVLGMAGALWLTLPLGLLSSLTAASRWAVFRPKILGLFFKHFGLVFRFYFCTALVLAACIGILYAAMTGPAPILLVPLAGLVAAAGSLIYARLLGRLGSVISVKKSTKKRSKQEKLVDDDDVQIFDPWAAPEAETRTAPPPPIKLTTSAPVKQKKSKPRTKPKAAAIDPWAAPADEFENPNWDAISQEPEDDSLGPVAGSYSSRSDRRTRRSAATQP